MNAVLSLDNLTVCYDRHPAVHHLSGAFPDGSLTAIVGPTVPARLPCSKPSLGLLPTTTGRIDRVALARSDIAYLPQQARSIVSFNHRLGRGPARHWRRIGALGGVTAELQAKAVAALAAVGTKRISSGARSGQPVGGPVSTGVVCADAVAGCSADPAGWPFTAIDADRNHGGFCSTWCAVGMPEQRTVIAVLHDLERSHSFPETLLLARSRHRLGAKTAQVLTPDNLRHARRMAEAWEDERPAAR